MDFNLCRHEQKNSSFVLKGHKKYLIRSLNIYDVSKKQDNKTNS